MSLPVKNEPVFYVFGYEHKPLSAAKKKEFKVNSKMPKRKFVNAEDPMPYDILPIDLKIKEIIQYLLVCDLQMGNATVPWSFTDTSGHFSWVTCIQKHEIFPYFLYKAVWDEDFEAIQWGDHEQGESILVNFELLFLFARGQGDFAKYRPPDYRDDFIPGQQNRLQHNLVNIFGFNAIGCCNLEEDRVLNERSHKYDDLFAKLDGICQKYQLNSKGRWHEFHHSDFYRSDNPNIDDRHRPKRKNSKFFKICQTLKLDYRLRKMGVQRPNEAHIPKPTRKRPDTREREDLKREYKQRAQNLSHQRGRVSPDACVPIENGYQP